MLLPNLLLRNLPLGFFLLGIILVQGKEQVEPVDIWDDAETALQDFIATVYAALDEAETEFNQIVQQLDALSADALEQAETDLQVVIDYMDGEVQDIRSQSNDQNREQLEHCIALYSDEMRRVPEYVRELISDCVSNLDANATMEITHSRVEASNQLIHAAILRNDIDGCHVATDSRDCISRVVIDILLKTLEVPTRIQEITRRTEDIIQFYEAEIPYCSRDRLSGAMTISGSIIGYIRSCASAA